MFEHGEESFKSKVMFAAWFDLKRLTWQVFYSSEHQNIKSEFFCDFPECKRGAHAC